MNVKIESSILSQKRSSMYNLCFPRHHRRSVPVSSTDFVISTSVLASSYPHMLMKIDTSLQSQSEANPKSYRYLTEI